MQTQLQTEQVLLDQVFELEEKGPRFFEFIVHFLGESYSLRMFRVYVIICFYGESK